STAPDMHTATGITTTRTMAMRTAPAISSPSSHVRPGLDLHQGAQRQRGHADRRPCGPVVAEAVDVDLVHRCVVAHVTEEHRRLDDVGEAGTLAGGLALEGGARPAELGRRAARD